MEVTADDIGRLLIEKYSKDFVCVPECNIGSAWMMKQSRRIDLWCMAKSWTRPRTIGYEIKVSRNDFLRDIKWRDYLPYCSEFYFVAPPGIINPDELPAEAGLLVSSKNAKMFYTKKKAPMRDVKIPETIFRYILMWRTQIVSNINEQLKQSNSEYWREWLENKAQNKELGYRVSRKVSEIVRDRIEKTENENIRLKKEIESLLHIKQFMKENGFNVSNWYGSEYQKKGLKEVMQRIDMDIPGGLIESIETSINSLKTAHSILNGEQQ